MHHQLGRALTALSLTAIVGGAALAGDVATAPPADAGSQVVCLSRTPEVTIRDTGSRIVARAEGRNCLGVTDGSRASAVPLHVIIEKKIGIPGQRRWQRWDAWGGRRSTGLIDAVVSIRREPGVFRARAAYGNYRKHGRLAQTGAILARPTGGGGSW